jgi:hypothetical protein
MHKRGEFILKITVKFLLPVFESYLIPLVMEYDRIHFLHRISISRQGILNFVGAHPSLTAIVAGLGIAFVFSSMGRFFVHEALAISSSSSSSSLVPAVDYIDKTPINSVPGTPHITYVLCACSCNGCGASEFTPGHEAISPGDAQNVAPGELAKSPGDASNFAPGEVFKKGLK